MKFKDIRKFTRCHSQGFRVDWRYLQDYIDRERGYIGDKLELDPDFQREHVWSEQQQTEYLEYRFRGGLGGANIYFNEIDKWKNDVYVGSKVLVDGKQRFNAVLRFLNNEVKAFGCYLNEFEDGIRFCRDAYFDIIVNDLKTRKEILTWYVEMNTGGTPHTDEEIERVKKLLAVS